MLNKQELKLKVMVAAILWMTANMAFADSAANQGALLQPATTTPNQMFLLDSGDVDFNTNSGSVGVVCQPANTTHQCFGPINGAGRMRVAKNCPTGFIPYIATTIAKQTDVHTSGSTAPGVSAVCPAQFWQHLIGQGGAPYSGIEFQYTNSEASNNGSTVGPGVAFHWAIYCYPGSYTNTPGPNNWTYSSQSGGTCSDATPWFCTGQASSCLSASFYPAYSAVDTTPLLLDSGYTTCENLLKDDCWIYTLPGKVCPVGYTGTITTSVYKGALNIYNSSSGNPPQNNAVYACPVLNTETGLNFMRIPAPAPNAALSQYRVKVRFSTSPSTLGNVGVSWVVSCYPPGTTTLPANDPNCPTDGAQVITPTQPIITKYLLSHQSVGLPNNNTQVSVYTSSACPTWWYPLASLSINYISHGINPDGSANSNPLYNAKVWLINPLSPSGSGYTATVAGSADTSGAGGSAPITINFDVYCCTTSNCQ